MKDHIQAAWEAYHGPITNEWDDEGNYIPEMPPAFRRGFVDGVAHASRFPISIPATREYYKFRGMEWPSAKEALDFAITEIGEAMDAYIRENQVGWVRNTPDKNTNFGWELADTYQMLMIAAHQATGKTLNELLLAKWESKGFTKNKKQ